MKKTTNLMLRLYVLVRPIWSEFECRVLQAYEIQKAEEVLARRRGLVHKRQPQPDQEYCSHLKGGSWRRTPYKDYALLIHTFIDGHKEAKCMICKKQFDMDSEEFKKMAQSTTNIRSTSEIIFDKKHLKPLDKI